MSEDHITKVVFREPTDKMVDQGLVYLPGVDHDALIAAWRVMYDVAPPEGRPKHPIRTGELAAVMGWSTAYASQVLTGVKQVSISQALRILDKTGHKFGPIAEANDREVVVLRKFSGALS